MAKASDAVGILDKAITAEHEQFKGIVPKCSFIENTGESSVESLLKKFQSKEEDEKWSKMYADKRQDQYDIADKAASVSFMESYHSELLRHYQGENEVSALKHAKVGSASFLTVKNAILDNVKDRG